MELSEQKQYEFENGKIRIQRHFGKTEQPARLVCNGVIQAARKAELLTAYSANGIISLSLREPQSKEV